MMLYIALATLLIGAAAALGLGRLAPTRTLGMGAAGLCGLGAALLAAEPSFGAALPPVRLLTLGGLELTLTSWLAAPQRALAVTLLGAGGLALATLSAAVAASVREFGAIFGWALLALAATLLSLATPITSLLLPLTWAVAALACYAALRSSGALDRSEAMPQGLVLGLLGSGLLLGAQAGAAPTLALGDQPPVPAALLALLGALAVGGLAPFFGARGEAVAAPAPLGALVHAVVMPGLAIGFVLRLAAALPAPSAAWTALIVAVGTLGALAAAALAAGERHLRASLAWLSAGQASAGLAVAGLGDGAALAGGHVLLLSTMLAGIGGAAAVSALERSVGSDDYTGAEPGPRMPLAGAIWALAGAAALGLPPLFGYWGRRWLLDGALSLTPWAVPPLLAASVLSALAVAAPLGRFWAPPQPDRASGLPGRTPALAGGLALVVLLVLGLLPQLAWASWLAEAAPAAPALPATLAEQIGAGIAGLAVLLLAWLIGRRPSARSLKADPDETPVRLAPEALADGLAPLAALGRPARALHAIWAGLVWLSGGVRAMIGLFEQRFYLLGVLMVLVVMMLLMAR